MFKTGLASVSFRSLNAEEIIRLTKECGLSAIEWGSDIHAPKDNASLLVRIKELMDEAGLYTSSYGTYFRIGETPAQELYGYISAAKILGTKTLRIWCGRKNYENTGAAERGKIIEEAKDVARIAEDAGVVLGIECHNNTFTSSPEGALSLMQGVSSPSLRMYWQPLNDEAQNTRYAQKISQYAVNVHVFNRSQGGKHPLCEGLDAWQRYLSFFDGTQHLLLEFMPDGLPESLAKEAEALRLIYKSII